MNEVVDSPTTSGEASDKPRSPFRLSHILVPTDFSPNSDKAMSYAMELAKLAKAKVTWKHLLFGSDAEQVLEHAPCPVLIVR